MIEVMNIITAIHYYCSFTIAFDWDQPHLIGEALQELSLSFILWDEVHYFCAMHVSSNANMAPEKVSS